MNLDELGDLYQAASRRWFQQVGTEPWTVVYEEWHNERANGGVFAALGVAGDRDLNLGRDSWDVGVNSSRPGLEETYLESGIETEYQSSGYGSFQPLIHVQRFDGIRADEISVADEFRLFHNLWSDGVSGTLKKIGPDGRSEDVVEIRVDLVRIRSPHLRQYIAAKQMDLYIYYDSVVFDPRVLVPRNATKTLREDVRSVNGRWTFSVGDRDLGIGPFSRVLAKRIVEPGPVADCGLPPFEQPQSYPEFIVGEDNAGRLQKFTCDPEQLNGVGSHDSEAPYPFTRVHFHREVLRRYLANLDLYEVGESYIRCGTLWSIAFDDDGGSTITVALGDLGRDLPNDERPYWLGQNTLAPSGLAVPEGSPTSRADARFRELYGQLNEAWRAKLGWPLFRDPHPDDAHTLQRLRIPLNDTQEEFEAQVLNMAKVLVDLLNEEAIVISLGSRVSGEKGITKLARFLEVHDYHAREPFVELLRQLQALRSSAAAHSKGTKYDELIGQALAGTTRPKYVASQLAAIASYLDDLLTFLDWIDFHPSDGGA